MAGANQRLDQQLTRERLEPGNIFMDTDVVRIGEAVVALVLRLAMIGFYDEANIRPAHGVLGEVGGIGSHLGVSKGTGDLEYNVETGAALCFNTAAAEDPFVELDYRLAVNATAITNAAVGAHHATLPRIDVVSILPADVQDTAENRVTRNVTTGNPTLPNPTVNIRSRAGGTITVTAGTPNASPTAPALAAGAVKLAEILVPATSGPIVVTDFRAFVSLTEAFRGLPPNWMHQNHAVSGLAVSGTTNYTVAPGHFTYAGLTRRYAGISAQSFGALPSGNNRRIDLISLTPTALGTAVRTAGTNVDIVAVDGGEPLAPALPAGNIALAEVLLDSAGVVSIRDVREFGFAGATQLRREAVTVDKVKRSTRTILIPGAAFGVDLGANTQLTTSGSKLTFDGSGGGGNLAIYAPLNLPVGTKILEVGWSAVEVAGTGTMQGSLTRNLLLGNGATPSQQTIAADAAPVALNNLITVSSPALEASENPAVVKSRWIYGFGITITLSAATTVDFLGAYVVVEGPELDHLGEAGDVS